ncbi:hypothetical protein [Halomonas sp. Mc5H-6]|nr:hypothetical protein [Halomonas sp. Mc5H-6]
MSLSRTNSTADRLPGMAGGSCVQGVFGYGYWFSNGVPMADA